MYAVLIVYIGMLYGQFVYYRQSGQGIYCSQFGNGKQLYIVVSGGKCSQCG